MAEQKEQLPLEMVFVRHGESEANVLQKADKEGRFDQMPDELKARPDWEHRLTLLGVEQAINAGVWIEQNIGHIATYFDVCYHSPFIRARETAAYIAPDAVWRNHNMLYERDWGEYGVTPRAERKDKFPFSAMMHEKAPLFARLAGGESIGEGVALRVDNFREDLRSRWSGKRVIATLHGDTFNGIRYIFEHMLPEEFNDMDWNKAESVGNCALLQLTRVNPEDPQDVRDYVGWRRLYDTYRPERSPFGGEWRELQYTGQRLGRDLLTAIDRFPRILGDS